MGLLAVWLAILLGGAGLDVRGSSDCPQATEVAERAAPLVVGSAALPSGTHVQIAAVEARTDGGAGAAPDLGVGSRRQIEVQLWGKDAATPLAVRRLTQGGSCGALAEAAAAVVASWLGSYDTLEPMRIEPVAVAERPGTSLALSRAAGSPAQPPRPWSLGAGVWLMAAPAARGGITGLVGPESTIFARDSRWFVRLALGFTGERGLPLEHGTASWWRVLAAPAVGRRWGEVLFLEASAGPVFGPVMVRGEGFTPNERDWAFDLGVSSGLRLGYRFGAQRRYLVWASGAGVGWLRPHEIAVSMSPRTTAVPPVDLLGGLGMSASFGS